MTTLPGPEPGQNPQPAPGWKPRSVDLTVPSTARMYDYWLGGKDNYAVDREAAEQVTAGHPQQRQLARNNRGFLQRAVQVMATAGIDQFIDIGTGIPTSPNVHETARDTHPEARVVYIDNDPVVLAHNRALLITDDNVTTIDADIRDPEAILDNPQLRSLIDFDQPVGILCVAVFHFVPLDEATQVMARFRDAMAPGSYFAASVGSTEGLTDDEVAQIAAGYTNATAPAVIRTRGQIEDIFTGFELLDPGLANVSQWRANNPETHGKLLAGVGRKP